MAAKGRARDKSLSKLGNRFISTMLKNEKLAEKELEKKMKAIKDLERKSMVKICESALDVKYDVRRNRNKQDLEEQIADDALSLSIGQGRVLRSPSASRRGSFVPVPPTTKQDDSDETASIASQETCSEAYSNPAIMINNEIKESDSAPGSRRSSVGSIPADAPSPTASPCGTPPDESSAIDEAEAQKMLKVFSQSSRGSHRRRTAPEITDLSPKLLIQMAKSSAEVKRRGSTHDGTYEDSLEPTPPASMRRRGSATIERAEQEKTEEPVSPLLRRRGSAAVTNSSVNGASNSPSGSPLLRRRGSSSVTNNKNSLSLEMNEAHLREKIAEQAPLSPRLKKPLSPFLGRRGSGTATSLRPVSAQPSTRGSDVASESMLPDLKAGAGLVKRPSSPSMRRSLSPMRAASNRPSTARSLSSLSADSALGEVQLEAGEYDLGRRRGSRPGSARSSPGGLLLPLDKIPGGHLSGRRGSELSQLDLNSLSPTSPLRKAMEDPQATLNPAQVSPSAYRRHSGTVEALQDRVDDFLKSLAAKGS
ncbi:hypothetical protein OS493_009926 [Desmophyllum pertusum]|uniref:Uncharacterized protein n=1 Tax=Desmophyllum pertusum TaxID=174260 RepID=A0A9W9YE48_9CNID|nr:hypothetical protein OS493_009926 [Desmophyllum pertusum]